jgi:hypothetical protein
MTRRSSVRAQAREIYRDLMAAEEAVQVVSPTPDPPSLRFGAASPSAERRGETRETDLTTRVRALYEQKAVPVREIAAMAGVSERTIYKYVAKHGWKRRYLVMPRGWAAVRDRGPRVTASRGAAPVKRRPGKSRIKRRARDRLLEPIKGAGGRFIRREDRHRPFASGLKATDPAGASRAVARSGKAARLAAQGLASAEYTRCSDASLKALIFAADALEKLVAYRARNKIQGNPPLGADAVHDALSLTSAVATESCQLAAKERGAAFAAWMALPEEPQA